MTRCKPREGGNDKSVVTTTGCKPREGGKYLYSAHNTDKQWTPIIKIKRTFIVKDHCIHRIQFTLQQATAHTIHVSQSSTYPEIYVDLETTTKPPTAFWEHMHYVAFSRVTSISGLYIKYINESNISISKRVSHYLNNSPPHNHLQTQIQFHDENTCNILLNNTCSFKKYFHTIKNNQIVLKQNINIFLESKLSQHDTSIDYQINNCIIIRADEKNTINPHCGIISYINSSLKINSIQNMSTELIDTLYMNISHKNKPIFTIYNSPKNTYTNLINHLLPKIDNEYLIKYQGVKNFTLVASMQNSSSILRATDESSMF